MIEIKKQPFKVDSDDPFNGDVLDREEEVINISTLITNISTPFVISITSPWGAGKTTFSLMLKSHLKGQDVLGLYFNAWESDFSDDPLISFLGEMNTEIKSILNTDEKKDAWNKAKQTGQYIAKKSLPALVKLGTAGIVDLDEDLEDAIKAITEDFAEDAINLYEAQKSVITAFKSNLEEVIDTIYEEDRDKPVVIFIDELDRCNPIYAINLLERIKHILNIPRVIFVLSIDKEQLSESIKNVYGSGFNSNVYLKRFIDLEYHLRESSRHKFIEKQFTNQFFDSFFEKRNEYTELRYEKGVLENTVLLVSIAFNLSLRDIEQLVSKVYVSLLSVEENHHFYPSILVYLIALKDKDPSLYQKFITHNDYDFDVISKLKNLLPSKKVFQSDEMARIEGSILNAFKGDENINPNYIISGHESIVSSDGPPNLEKRYLQNVIYIFSNGIGKWGNNIDLNQIIKRINMSDRFNI